MNKYPPFEFLGVEDLDCAVFQVLATVGVAALSVHDQAPLDLLFI
jgi:hypothetical protein